MTTRNEIAALVGAAGNGHDLVVRGVSSAFRPRANTLAFVKAWSAELGTLVATHADTVFLVPEGQATDQPHAIQVTNPRLEFARVVRDLLAQPPAPEIASTAVIGPDARLGRDVSIGHFTLIEDGAVLGDGVSIGSHCIIRGGVTIGDRSNLASHVSVGGSGFGFEVEADGVPVRIHHLGGVEIGADVEIGQHVSIAQGTIEPTRIADQVKIDDCVFIAHNVQVGEAAFIIAGAEVSGSVTIGQRAWISPEATILNQVVIGDDALVGIGAVVIRDVPSNTIVAGVPAKERGPRHAEAPTE